MKVPKKRFDDLLGKLVKAKPTKASDVHSGQKHSAKVIEPQPKKTPKN